MKKLIKLFSLTIALAVVFVGCGNPVIPQEQDDGETVEQFIQRLIDFKEGITADNSVKFTFGTYNSVFAFMFYIKKMVNL